MKAWLERQGIPVSRKRVQRLMRVMGLRAIYRRPRTSRPAQGALVAVLYVGPLGVVGLLVVVGIEGDEVAHLRTLYGDDAHGLALFDGPGFSVYRGYQDLFDQLSSHNTSPEGVLVRVRPRSLWASSLLVDLDLDGLVCFSVDRGYMRPGAGR